MPREQVPKDLKTWRERVAWNKAQPCAHCGLRNRVSISPLCSNCSRNLFLLGHVDAKAVRLSELKHLLVEAARLIDLNDGHPALAAYDQWFAEWCRMAQEEPLAVPAAAWMKRLRPEQGRDVLKILVAVYLSAEVERNYKLPDLKAVYFQMFKLLAQTFVPVAVKDPLHWSRIPAATRKATALYLQRSVGPLLMGFKQALENEAEERRKAHEVLSQPLDFERVKGLPT